MKAFSSAGIVWSLLVLAYVIWYTNSFGFSSKTNADKMVIGWMICALLLCLFIRIWLYAKENFKANSFHFLLKGFVMLILIVNLLTLISLGIMMFIFISLQSALALRLIYKSLSSASRYYIRQPSLNQAISNE